MEPKRGALAFCSLGSMGIITSNKPEEVVYLDGTKGIAWVGMHLTDKIAPIGSSWSARNPVVIAYLQ